MFHSTTFGHSLYTVIYVQPNGRFITAYFDNYQKAMDYIFDHPDHDLIVLRDGRQIETYLAKHKNPCNSD